MIQRRTKRSGFALVIALVLIAVVAMIAIALAKTLLASRQILERRHQQLQAEWLARGGIERVRAQVLRGEKAAGGEWRPLDERALVSVVVQAKNNATEVTSEAAFPVDELRPVRREAKGIIAIP